MSEVVGLVKGRLILNYTKLRSADNAVSRVVINYSSSFFFSFVHGEVSFQKT